MPENPGLHWSPSQCRGFLLDYHGLLNPMSLKGKEGILEYIQKVGCIQFDPLNICGRNPDLLLQSRVKDYDPVLLEELLYKDRLLMEGWDKMMSIYHRDDNANLNLARKEIAQDYLQRFPEVEEHLEDYLNLIRDKGPLSSLDFKGKTKIPWAWGKIRLVKASLEYLFFQGKLSIHHRKGGRRIFDLTQRLHPEAFFDSSQMDIDSYRRWHILRRLESSGMAGFGFRDFWFGIARSNISQIKKTLKDLVEEGLAVPIKIGSSNSSWYLPAKALENFQKRNPEPSGNKTAVMLAPLDNMMWNRELLEEAFEFHYRWEVYTPAAKRQYGYYVLPILYNGRIIARCEPRLDRKAGKLTLKGIWFEDGIIQDDELIFALRAMFSRFCRFLKADEMLGSPSLDRGTRSLLAGIKASQ